MLLTFKFDLKLPVPRVGPLAHSWEFPVVGAPIGGLTSSVGATPRGSLLPSLAPTMTLLAIPTPTPLANILA